MDKIFGVGLSRTGTTSLTRSLSNVGIDIIHYPKKTELFDPKNAGACDIPVIVHYKELDKIFPNSKFIYTIRDKEEWLSSMERYLPRKKNWNLAKWQLDNRKAVYGRLDFDREWFAERYDIHDNDVRMYFKERENDLLILNICGGDKLEKLFSFIGVSNHKNMLKEFPHENKLR